MLLCAQIPASQDHLMLHVPMLQELHTSLASFAVPLLQHIFALA